MARVRPARTWQHPRAPIRLVASAGRAKLKRTLRQALPHIDDLFDRERARYLIQHGRTREVIDALDMAHFREILKAVFDQWARIFEAGAALGTRKINAAFHARSRKVRFRKDAIGHNITRGSGGDARDVEERMGIRHSDAPDGEAFLTEMLDLGKAIGDRFNFDRFDEETQRDLRAIQDDLIGELSTDARDVIERTILEAQMRGAEASEIVEEIRDVIGLNARQAAAVRNYRRSLENMSSDALGRGLRDSAFDSMFRDAREQGEDLGRSTIDDMVESYADNMLDYRARMIAQTESVRAANYGLHEAYRQAVDRGALPSEAVKRYWQIALDEKTCPICLSIPDANPDGVEVGEPFESDDGPQDDPPVHPNCRCSVEYVTDLDKVPDEEEEG